MSSNPHGQGGGWQGGGNGMMGMGQPQQSQMGGMPMQMSGGQGYPQSPQQQMQMPMYYQHQQPMPPPQHKACSMLTNVIKTERGHRGESRPTAEECQSALEAIALDSMLDEAREREQQFQQSVDLLSSSLPTMQSEQKRAERQAEIEAYRRQCELDITAMRDAHTRRAQADSAEVIPYLMVAQSWQQQSPPVAGPPLLPPLPSITHAGLGPAHGGLGSAHGTRAFAPPLMSTLAPAGLGPPAGLPPQPSSATPSGSTGAGTIDDEDMAPAPDAD